MSIATHLFAGRRFRGVLRRAFVLKSKASRSLQPPGAIQEQSGTGGPEEAAKNTLRGAVCALGALLGAFLIAPPALAQGPFALLQQQANKLVGTGATAGSQQGNSVAISADGNTAIVGAPDDNSQAGAAWIFTRTNGVWAQQGTKLVGSGASNPAQQGWSVAISGDGNTALVGGPGDNSGVGAVWVFTQSGGVWTQQGSKLVPSSLAGSPAVGWSVAISGDGNTAAIGAYNLNVAYGGIFVFRRSAGTWSQQGNPLIASETGEGAGGQLGYSVAISLDGNRIVGGANADSSGAGSVWVFQNNAGTWSVPARFVGAGAAGSSDEGAAVAISGDGNVIAAGGPLDSSGVGAVWIYTFQVDHFASAGSKITVSGSDGVGNSAFGASVALSRDGSVLVVGGFGDNSNQGAVWQFGRTSLTAWTQQGAKLIPSDASSGAEVGTGVAISADGNTGFFGGIINGSATGASWGYDANVNLGSTSVGANDTKNISVQVRGAFTVGSVSVVTEGAPNLDFTAAASQPSSGACQTGAVLVVGSTCSINIEFAPTAPGTRLGAILLYDGSSALQATVFIYGIGLGPQVSFSNPVINTVAGTYSATGGYTDDVPALDAEMNGPYGTATDSAANLYIADFSNVRVRFVNQQASTVTALNVTVPAGHMKTVAGNGTEGYSSDNIAATTAEIGFPEQLVLDGAGNLYITDTYNNRIRRVDATTGLITTFAGGGGSSADGVLATNAALQVPQGVTVGGNGDIFIGDTRSNDNKVHRVSATTGIITTVAGAGPQGYSGDGGTAMAAQIFGPLALALDTSSNLYIDDDGDNLIREVSYGTGIINTVAGNYGLGAGFSGDGEPATSAQLNDPEGLAVDAAGDIYIPDSSNNVVRKVNAFTGIINTIAGSTTTSTGYSGDGGPAVDAFLNYPVYPALDSAGNLYFPDDSNDVVREIGGAAPLAFADTSAGATSAAQDVTVMNDGNASMTFTSLVASANFDVNGADTTCTITTTLNPGDACVLGIEFSPVVAGSISGSVTLVDNAGSQIISLSGNGLQTPTTTAVTADPNPVGQGEIDTLTATVTPAPLGFPLGSVTFSIGATSLGSGNVNSFGVATLATTSLPLGVDSITARYSGNSGFGGSTSSAADVTVNTVTPTATAFTASPNPASTGQTVTLTAMVSPAPTGSPLGSVVFCDGGAPSGAHAGPLGRRSLRAAKSHPLPSSRNVAGGACGRGTVLGTEDINSSGIATLAISALSVGSHTLTAVYSGNAAFSPSTSTAIIEVIDALSTTTTLEAAPNPANVGESVTLSASVSPAPTGSPLGSIDFMDGSTLLSTVNIDSSGAASFATSSLAAGSHTLTAVYSGNAEFGPSTSTAITEVINAASTSTTTTITLTISPNPAFDGDTVTLTATITPAPTGSTSGTVTFCDAGAGPSIARRINGARRSRASSVQPQVSASPCGSDTALGTENVNAQGVATLTLTSLTTGGHSIYAVYSGNSGFANSTSSGTSETVDPSYKVTATPTPVDVSEGGSVDVTVTVPPFGGAFNSPVTLSASGLPAGATATFNPPTVTPGASGQQTMMTIQLAKVATALPRSAPAPTSGTYWSGGLAAVGLLLLGFVARRRRLPGVAAVLLAVSFISAAAALSGCNGGFAGLSTRPGQYIVTITGTSGTLHESTTVTVVVQ